MNKFIRVLAGLGILAAGVGFTVIMVQTKPQAKKKNEKPPLPVVEFVDVKFIDVPITVPSQGMVEAARTTNLAAEVGGKVIRVSDKFDIGGRFKEGEELIYIDDSDYRASAARMEAQLAEMKLSLATEETRAEQALRDWKKLGGTGVPSDLTLRKPHMEVAKAGIKAAEAEVEKAKRDVERTIVRAPFAGTLEDIQTEVGNYIMPGSPVAQLFANAPFEIRLPVSLDDARFVKANEQGDLIGSVKIAADNRMWDAKIIRTEGRIDRTSRSMHLVAEVGEESPNGATGPRLLQPGLFVQAAISGRTVTNVAKIPFSAFLDLNRVVVIDPDNKLRFREVDILRREADEVLISGGLKEGERVCVTELADMIEGRIVDPQAADAPPVLTGNPEGNETEIKP